MFIPSEFKIKDNELTLQFIKQYNFGILLCNGNEIPASTHLPFYIGENANNLVLVTHLAKANTQWQFLEKNSGCLIIFNGPNGYVSPSNYGSTRNVPTWNYMTVHLHAKAEVIHEASEKRKIMHHTIDRAEKEFEKQYATLPADYLDKMYEAIVGLRLRVVDVETKFKLSQNKPEEDKKNVADYFERNGNKELAEWMRKINKT
jgi:transcriptional regulator